MPKRLSYKQWKPTELLLMEKHGPHFSARKLHEMLGGRHTLQAVQAKLRHMHITKTPERLRVAVSEGILGSAAKQLRCASCGSSDLEPASAGFGRESPTIKWPGRLRPRNGSYGRLSDFERLHPEAEPG